MNWLQSLLLIQMFSGFIMANFEKDLQLKLIMAEDGDTIKLEPGVF
tara:strand:- start:6 stop:143 length:138 start_codon:yes stop_codon:yes gene_type:complete